MPVELPRSVPAVRRYVSGLAAFLVIVLVTSIVGDGPVFAAPAAKYAKLVPQDERHLPAKPVPVSAKSPDAAAASTRKAAVPAPVWPAAAEATADVPLAAASGSRSASQAVPEVEPVRAGATPVLVGPPRDSVKSLVSTGRAPSRVKVSVLGHASAEQAHAAALLRVSSADSDTSSGRISVAVDYSGFASAYGADYGARLRLVQLPECALTQPDAPGCHGTALPSRNSRNVVSADVDLTSAAPAGAMSANSFAAPTALLAVDAGPSGATGSLSATQLAGSGSWFAGGSSGDFTWQYGVRTPPPIASMGPTVALAYSSQAVDGRTAATNNQPSWIGEGFDYAPGFIERKYKACLDDMGGTAGNTEKTGDECWGPDNAMVSYSGGSGELVYDDASHTWHPQNDDGSRVEHLTGGTNGDNDGEYWKITTADGTQYFFGLNRLPGWSTGRPETRSAYTVPVFGNNPGEPCHASTFASSWCQQAYRWNLDYVVDAHGNSMSYWYNPETNYYSRNLTDSSATQYVRGGTLARIDYNTRTDAEFGNAPARVLFDTADRCDTNCGSHGANWPDTPWDQNCDGGSCKDHYGPTFWTTKALSKITTQVWNPASGGYQDVEAWTLHHSFPDPGDGSRAGLWLNSITHSGFVGGTATLPDITFSGVQLQNRVDGIDHSTSMNWFRISDIYTEAGGRITVTYSDRECVAGSNIPPSPDSNTKRCFPVYWTPQGATDPVLDWFHKYVVTNVVETDRTSGQHRLSTSYTYPNPPAWHYDESSVGFVPDKQITWSQWRGYDRVVTVKGDPGEQAKSESLFFRGMDGDRLSGGGHKQVTVTASEGGPVTDAPPLQGAIREAIVDDAVSGALVSSVISDMWQSAPTATHTANGRTASAYHVALGATHTRSLLDLNRGWRRSSSSTQYDSYGMTSQIQDNGDDSVNGDEQCRTITYTRNTTAWIINKPAGSTTTALPCGQSPATADDVLSDSRVSYDGQAFGVAPTKGDVTSVEIADGWAPGTGSHFVVNATAVFDPYGRPTDTADILGRHTRTDYTPATGGPVVKVVNTNPLGWTTTRDLDPAFGNDIDTVDVNSKRTDISYDPFGRRTAVWQPGRVKGTDSANVTYEYLLRTDAPNAVITHALMPDGVSYVTGYQLYDGMLRPRQTQMAAPGGGRTITDTFYDTVGRQMKANAAWYNEGAPGTAIAGVDDNLVPSQTVSQYDGVGRLIKRTLRSNGADKSYELLYHAGDRDDVTPPSGGTPMSTLTDVQGRTTELRQYHGGSPAGAYDATRYEYNRAGQLSKVTDPAGNEWSTHYDFLGQQISTNGPDRGHDEFTYDSAGRIATTKDTLGQVLAYSYDDLDRLVALYDTSTTGNLRASWTYDTLLKGMPSSSTRYVGGATGSAYTTAVLGYTDRYQPTGQKVTIPAAEGLLAGSYSFGTTYRANGALSTMSYPAAGGLPKESVSIGYSTDLGLPVTMASLASNYVSDTQYTRFGEPSVTTMSPNRPQDGAIVGPIFQTGLYYEEATRRVDRSVVSRQTAPTFIADVHYTFDDAGNITKIADTPQGKTADTQCFKQDYLARLTDAWTPADGNCATAPSAAALGGPAPYWQSWEYDLTGNRTKFVEHALPGGDATTQSTYPAAKAAQPHTLVSTTRTYAGATTTKSFQYDAAGNTSTRPGQNLTWDPEGHLTKVTENGADTTFLYDASGNRLIRKDNTSATLYLGGIELRLNRASNQVTCTRFYSFNGQVIAVRNASGLSWLASDHQGTQSITVDAATQAVTQRFQTPFGGTRGSAPVAWPTEKGFVGGDKDTTDLTRIGAREYDSTTGRFLSVDPVFQPSNPQALNGYAYANNSPITSSDPSGLISWGGLLGGLLDAAAEAALNYAVYGVCMAAFGVESGGLATPLCGAAAGVVVYVAKNPHHITTEGVVRAAVEGAVLGKLMEKLGPLMGKLADWIETTAVKWLGSGAASTLAKIIRVAFGSPKEDGGGGAPKEDGAPSGKSDEPGGKSDDPSATDPKSSDTPTDNSTSGENTNTNTSSDAGTSDAGPPKDPKAPSKPRGCTSHSFDPATPVLLADGSTKPIGEVKVGDEVIATDPETGVNTTEPVVLLHDNQDTDLTSLTVRENGKDADVVLHTTWHHPFWDETRHDWVDAQDLKPGDELHTQDGKQVEVRAVMNTVGSADMRDLTVDHVHTYYVMAGNTPVLVHNCNTRIASSDQGRAHNAAAFEENGHNGFSGVYDPATDTFHARQSGGDGALVSRAGGHGQINREVFGESRNTIGFVAIRADDGVINMRWNSVSVNVRNFGQRSAPEVWRGPIMDSIRRATGLEVVG